MVEPVVDPVSVEIPFIEDYRTVLVRSGAVEIHLELTGPLGGGGIGLGRGGGIGHCDGNVHGIAGHVTFVQDSQPRFICPFLGVCALVLAWSCKLRIVASVSVKVPQELLHAAVYGIDCIEGERDTLLGLHGQRVGGCHCGDPAHADGRSVGDVGQPDIVGHAQGGDIRAHLVVAVGGERVFGAVIKDPVSFKIPFIEDDIMQVIGTGAPVESDHHLRVDLGRTHLHPGCRRLLPLFGRHRGYAARSRESGDPEKLRSVYGQLDHLIVVSIRHPAVAPDHVRRNRTGIVKTGDAHELRPGGRKLDHLTVVLIRDPAVSRCRIHGDAVRGLEASRIFLREAVRGEFHHLIVVRIRNPTLTCYMIHGHAQRTVKAGERRMISGLGAQIIAARREARKDLDDPVVVRIRDPTGSVRGVDRDVRRTGEARYDGVGSGVRADVVAVRDAGAQLDDPIAVLVRDPHSVPERVHGDPLGGVESRDRYLQLSVGRVVHDPAVARGHPTGAVRRIGPNRLWIRNLSGARPHQLLTGPARELYYPAVVFIRHPAVLTHAPLAEVIPQDGEIRVVHGTVVVEIGHRVPMGVGFG